MTTAAKLGRTSDLLDPILGDRYANHLGLYAGQTGISGEALGNFPQPFAKLALISALIGMSYGVFFRRETLTWQMSVGWGLLYGLVWWYLGPLTLLPLLLGEPCTWTTADADATLPWLTGPGQRFGRHGVFLVRYNIACGPGRRSS